MRAKFYTTGNVICGECGRFLTPELRRLNTGVPTGELTVTGHQPTCSLFGKALTLKLLQLQGPEVLELDLSAA